MAKTRSIQKEGIVYFIFAALIFFMCLTAFPGLIDAESREDIQKKISEKNEEIKRLELEAAQYKNALEEKGREVNTLRARVQSLDKTISRISADIRLTNAKMNRTALEIQKLGTGIDEQEFNIAKERIRLGRLVESLAEHDQETPLAILMKHTSLSAFFNSVDQLVAVQRNIQESLVGIRKTRAELKEQKGQAEQKKIDLAVLGDNLADQKTLQEYERTERANLLKETKNQERRYQELLTDVARRRDSLQQEINSLEENLKATFDPNRLPTIGSRILAPPLENFSPKSCWNNGALDSFTSCVTQFFGNTEFAKSGAYNGKGHNGIDLRAPAGTAVYASDQGTVRATGDTDTACRRASYGKWVLIDHPNNLTTLYAHLSLIKIRAGDSVNRGELIGYSGRTGYATGPHLHFTVYAREAVQIGQLKSRICGSTMTLPLSPFRGYLDPLDYL